MTNPNDPLRCKVDGREVMLTPAEVAAMPPGVREQVAVWMDDGTGFGWIRPYRFSDTGEWLQPVER